MIYVGSCLEILPTLPADHFDSIVTDPPYGLEFMGKDWDAPWKDARTDKRGVIDPAAWGGNQDSVNGGNAFSRTRTRTSASKHAGDHAEVGRQFQEWCRRWAVEALRVAKPGAYLAAFGGTRMYHRLASGLEDAGWEVRDTLMWVYGSGFPKSHNGEWGGTALKPAWEPIILARKPLDGTVEANWRKHGTGALNIDGCRVLAEPMPPNTGAGGLPRRHDTEDRGPGEVSQPHTLGRWPANLVHDGSDEVVAMFPAEAGAQAPVTTRNGDKFRTAYGAFAGNVDEQGSTFQGDSGSAARFFYCAKASKKDRDSGLEGFELREAGIKNESGRGFSEADPHKKIMRGNHHPTVKPTELMRWLCRLVTPAGGLVLDPFTGSGSTGRAASAEGMRFVGIELSSEYATIAEARIRAVQPGLCLGVA